MIPGLGAATGSGVSTEEGVEDSGEWRILMPGREFFTVRYVPTFCVHLNAYDRQTSISFPIFQRALENIFTFTCIPLLKAPTNCERKTRMKFDPFPNERPALLFLCLFFADARRERKKGENMKDKFIIIKGFFSAIET